MIDPSIDEIMAEVGFEMAMDKSDEADRLRARIERLEAAIQWLMKQPWKSIDKDNMEFQVIVSCYVRDALLAALAGKEG